MQEISYKDCLFAFAFGGFGVQDTEFHFFSSQIG